MNVKENTLLIMCGVNFDIKEQRAKLFYFLIRWTHTAGLHEV